MDVYNKQFLDDFGHLLAAHDSGCAIEKCAFTHRHNGNEEDNALNDIDLNFWVQALDAAHFQIFHLYETGMRSLIDDKDDDENDHVQKDANSQHYDEKFAKFMRKIAE